MNIAGTEINLRHKAFEIYLSGCKGPHCAGCHNSELWSFDVGYSVDPERIDKLCDKVLELNQAKLIDYVWVLGGEPLDNPVVELLFLLKQINKAIPKIQVVLWTHYESVPEEIKPYIDYAKLGPYVQGGTKYTEPVLGVELANVEQRIIII